MNIFGFVNLLHGNRSKGSGAVKAGRKVSCHAAYSIFAALRSLFAAVLPLVCALLPIGALALPDYVGGFEDSDECFYAMGNAVATIDDALA